MPSVHDALRAAGIGLAQGGRRLEVRYECARLARVLRERYVGMVGLAPAADDVAVPGIALELGRALAEKSRKPVGIVDALGSWTCARMLIECAAPDSAPLATSWLDANLALLTPRTFDARAMLLQLRGLVADETSPFSHLVVDLTGLDHLGEQLEAYELLDAVAVVARSGRTTSRQIQRSLATLPRELGVGVLLTGV